MFAKCLSTGMRFAAMRTACLQLPRQATQPAYPAARGYSTQLAGVLAREVAAEEANLKELQVVDVPPGFTLQDRAGSTLVILKASHGDEIITVQATVPSKLEFDTPNAELSIPFDVLIEKPKCGVLEFQCRTAEAGYDVESLAVFDEKEKKIAKDETAEADYARDLKYAGPALEDLEGDLQEGIAEYLEERNINEDLARFIQNYVKEKKEPEEYVRWLQGLHKFLQ